MKITLARLRELFQYEPATGRFIRLLACKTAKPGDVAGSLCKSLGYRMIRIDGVLYYEHRLAWLYMTGNQPTGLIDHINTDKTDNRFCNLRDVSPSTNSQNRKAPSRSNKTGFLGVTKNGNGFRALIFIGGKQRNLGTYRTPALAHEAYVAAKRAHHSGNTL